ncbi:MAG: MarR family transcriptional regulator [Candidatus Woesearchaeota archaeon]|jgi:uncharacterized membrane protein|nr:MarR family transcriptional regulator [Candidatus Woesearchaeota archaeon]
MKLFRYTLFLFILLFFSSFVYSGFYADISIDIKDNGEVSIDGKTNYALFQNVIDSQSYTSKNAEYWVLNLSSTEKFDNYIFELNLPKGAQINYIRTTPNMRIDESNSRLKIIGTGEDKPFTLIVQYKIDKVDSSLLRNSTFIVSSIIFFIALIIILSLLFKLKEKSKKQILVKDDLNLEDNEDFSKSTYNLENLTQRQQEIVKLIEKHKKMTQKQLEAVMNIPKSSVSRNVQSLVIKGILKKEKAGQSNYIEINLE